MKFPRLKKPFEVMAPKEQTFHFPSASISSQYPTILCFRFFTIRLVRSDKCGSLLFSEALIKRIAIISCIAHNSAWRLVEKSIFYCIFNYFYFS